MKHTPQPIVLTDDQRQALSGLLNLVHYDDLAATFYAMLPAELQVR